MTTLTNLVRTLVLTLSIAQITTSVGLAEWQPHEVRQQNGKDPQIRLPAQFQMLTESWDRVVAVPYIVYMPEQDRLLMLANCDYPHRAFMLTSDDHGASWTAPYPALLDEDGKPAAIMEGAGLAGDMGTGLAYLGNGTALFYTGSGRQEKLVNCWFSRDYGKTWGDSVLLTAPSSSPKSWLIWDPPLVDRDPQTGKVTQLAQTSYQQTGTSQDSQAFLRFSPDEGQTWGRSIQVPQWRGVNEVALLRAGNGDLVAGCRTDVPPWSEEKMDHYEGLGTSVSTDDGQTWSTVNILYDHGRHHQSLVLMPDGDVVMTYVVRKGYVDSKDGFPQFGIEAIVSHDHGRTWDLDHKYILHAWVGNLKGENGWWPSSQSTSSRLLPDGSIITAFGTGYRIRTDEQAPRDVGLVRWRLNTEPVNTDRTIRDAAIDSDRRNIFDPSL
jgi:hypothetical protein